MSEQTSMSKMVWEIRYSDDSGVEYGISYDSNKKTNEGVGAIIFESIDTTEFPQSKIDWLIDCLQKIKLEQGI